MQEPSLGEKNPFDEPLKNKSFYNKFLGPRIID